MEQIIEMKIYYAQFQLYLKNWMKMDQSQLKGTLKGNSKIKSKDNDKLTINITLI